MRSKLSFQDLERLKREAKKLRRGTSLTHTEALDRLARELGWPSWALAQRNAMASDAFDAIELSVEPFENGDHGVFWLRLRILDGHLQTQLEQAGDFHFELPPIAPRWIVRRFTPLEEGSQDPFLSHAGSGSLIGRFSGGKFLCIVSTNGVQPVDVEAEINATRSSICMAIKAAAVQQARMWLGQVSAGARLFFSVPNGHGIDSLQELACPDVEAAFQAPLPPAATPIGISTAQGWWTYTAPFGWAPPAPAER